jgi:hypothetical protein
VERHKRVSRILCPKCGANGTVVWQKEPLHARSIDTLTRGFLSIDRGAEADPHCECASCRVAVVNSDTGAQADDAVL